VIDVMNRLASQQPPIRTLSARVNLSEARLRELFKKEIGCSPKQYLKEVRMKQAEDLLKNTFLSIKEVSYRCGAGDVSHFVRDFKRYCGQTPRAFRAAGTVTKRF
jgi:AraC-like DNA-binding protein